MPTDETTRLAGIALGGVLLFGAMAGDDGENGDGNGGGNGNGDENGDENGGDNGNGNGGEPTDHTIAVVAESSGAVNYTIAFEAESVTAAGSGDLAAESNDTITDNGDGTWTVTGFTGNAGFGDTYAYTGTVADVSMGEVTASFRIEIDGADVTDQFVDDDGSGGNGGNGDPQTDPIGGGAGYTNTYTSADADHTATTRSGLHNALSSASSGDVVFVPGGATIDAATDTFDVPGGVTLASDRGVNGSDGGTIVENVDDNGLRAISTASNVTIAGIRVVGPHRNEETPNADPWSEGHGGIQFGGSGGVVENCEVAGWGYFGIGGNPDRVHHSLIHHCAHNGLGYGIMAGNSTLIERNLFGRCRHCIAAHGSDSYEARENVVEANQRHHAFDHHGSGGSVNIHHNTFKMTPGSVDQYPSAYRQREDANDTWIHHNWAYNTTGFGHGGDATWRVAGGNYTIEDNHLGTNEPDASIGAPR